MNDQKINQNLSKLDGSGSDEEFAAVRQLEMLGDRFPSVLLAHYRNASNWGSRASCVYHAIKYAHNNDAAFQLGLLATAGQSKHVRYRACMLLAVSQNPLAIDSLESLLIDPDSAADAEAAIDAIRGGNHHYFVDRDHSGKSTLRIASIPDTRT